MLKSQNKVLYTSLELKMDFSNAQNTSPEHALKFLRQNPEVQFIHCHWVDMSGVVRVRVLPKASSLKLALERRPLKAGASALLGLCGLPDSFRPGSVSCMWLDWTSARLLRPKHASVICNASEELASHADVDPQRPFQRCPRSVLQSLLANANSEDRISYQLGFELEFYLMSKEDLKGAIDNTTPPSHNFWSTTFALRDDRGTCLEACVTSLLAAGIEVQQYHAETGRFMYEISTGHMPALVAIDTWYQSLEIVKQTATNHGFRATFLPKPFPTLCCLGQHVHLSIHEEDPSSEGQIPNKQRQDWFLAGILHRLPLLCAYGMPCDQSFQRFEEFALAPLVSWGTENRDAPIRKIKDGHWELRMVDGTANFYLVVAAFIAAGLLGLRSKQALRWGDNRDFLSKLDDGSKNALGIHTAIPKALDESLNLCKSDYMGIDSLLGKQILEFYSMVKDGEQQYLSTMSVTERKKMYYDLF